MTATFNGFNGVSVYVTIGSKMFTPEDINLLQMDVTDSDEGDNEVELHCADDDFRIADSQLFRVGQILSIKFGFTGREMSEDRSGYVVMKSATSYGKDGTVSKIHATTKSATLHARRPQKSYGATSLKQVISDIASRNSLRLVTQGGTERMPAFSQGTWTDRDTLRALADRFNYQCTFTSDTLTFAPRDYGLVPKLELVFGQGEVSNILAADLSVNAKKEDSVTEAVNFNPASKEVKSVTAGEATKALAVSAENGHTWVTQGTPAPNTTTQPGIISDLSKKADNSSPSASDVKTLLSTPDTVEGNIQAHATSDKLRKQKKKGEFTVTTTGIPSAKPRILVNVRGVARRDSGNWYVSQVTHTIGKHDGFQTKFELNRHGANTVGGERTKSPLNTQLPQNNSKTTTPIVSVSAETGQITRKP